MPRPALCQQGEKRRETDARFNPVADLIHALETFPDGSPVEAMAAFKCAHKENYKRVPDIVDITPATPAAPLEASDFSYAGIERRVGEGAALAHRVVAAGGFLSAARPTPGP